MNDQSAAFEQLRFATSDLPVAERWPTFLDMGRTVAKVDCMPLEDDFFVDGSFCKLPAAGVGSFSSSALRATRSRALAEGSDDLIFYMSIEGTANIAHLGREATVCAGESILVTSADPLRMDRSRIRYVHATIPRSVLAPTLRDFDSALMRPMPDTGEAVHLLRGYLSLLAATPSLQGSDISGLASAHVTDLIAFAVGATRDAAEIAAGRGVRAVRLRAIKADIESNLAVGDVGSDALAGRHRVSSASCSKARGHRSHNSCLAAGWRWSIARCSIHVLPIAPSAPSPSTSASATCRPSTTPSAGISA